MVIYRFVRTLLKSIIGIKDKQEKVPVAKDSSKLTENITVFMSAYIMMMKQRIPTHNDPEETWQAFIREAVQAYMSKQTKLNDYIFHNISIDQFKPTPGRSWSTLSAGVASMPPVAPIGGGGGGSFGGVVGSASNLPNVKHTQQGGTCVMQGGSSGNGNNGNVVVQSSGIVGGGIAGGLASPKVLQKYIDIFPPVNPVLGDMWLDNSDPYKIRIRTFDGKNWSS